MTRNLQIIYQGRISTLGMTPIDRKRLHGSKRKLALDENGNECTTAHLTRDGRFLLETGTTADIYTNADGDAVNRNELVAVDHKGNSLPVLSATLGVPQTLEGLVGLDEFLDHVVTKVYLLEAETLDPALQKTLNQGGIFRVPYRPRPTHTETPAFLMANEHGIFLVQAQPCNFEFVGLEQAVSEEDEEYLDAEMDLDEFAFDFDLEPDNVYA